MGYYESAGICSKCNMNCLRCTANICMQCSNSKALRNGCTSVIGCIDILDYSNINNNCNACDISSGFMLDPISKTCICPSNYRINNKICHNIQGCIGPVLKNGIIVCLLCNYI